MNSFGPIEIGLIVAIIIAIICFILFLVALKSKNNIKHKASEEYNLKEQQLKSSHEEALEKERIENKKQVTKQKEEFETIIFNVLVILCLLERVYISLIHNY